jgi:hypothetical protein
VIPRLQHPEFIIVTPLNSHTAFDKHLSSMSETAAQEKARLRREKRAGGGVNRLQAITSLQGGTHRDIEKDVPSNSK